MYLVSADLFQLKVTNFELSILRVPIRFIYCTNHILFILNIGSACMMQECKNTLNIFSHPDLLLFSFTLGYCTVQ